MLQWDGFLQRMAFALGLYKSNENKPRRRGPLFTLVYRPNRLFLPVFCAVCLPHGHEKDQKTPRLSYVSGCRPVGEGAYMRYCSPVI